MVGLLRGNGTLNIVSRNNIFGEQDMKLKSIIVQFDDGRVHQWNPPHGDGRYEDELDALEDGMQHVHYMAARSLGASQELLDYIQPCPI